MAKVKTYEFWFVQNKMYASRTVKRAYWWNKWLLLSGCLVLAKCSFKAVDITDNDALTIAKIEFEKMAITKKLWG